jgi:hypothetical protein
MSRIRASWGLRLLSIAINGYFLRFGRQFYIHHGLKRIAKADALGLTGTRRGDYLRRCGGRSLLAVILVLTISAVFGVVTILAVAAKAQHMKAPPACNDRAIENDAVQFLAKLPHSPATSAGDLQLGAVAESSPSILRGERDCRAIAFAKGNPVAITYTVTWKDPLQTQPAVQVQANWK